MSRRFIQKGFCLLFWSAALRAGAQTPPAAVRNHFDSDAAMRAPAYFDFAEVGAPGASDWVVMSDFNPPSAPNIVVQTVGNRPADSIAVAIRRNLSCQDGRWSVALKRARGRSGILFRMQSQKDFLVLLVDFSSGDARLVSYRGGKPAELARGQAVFDLDWGVLAVEASGGEVKATWAGRPLLSAKDPAPASGRAGMATAGPGSASFDEFIVEPAEKKT